MPWASLVGTWVLWHLPFSVLARSAAHDAPNISIWSSGEPLPSFGPQDIVFLLYSGSRPVPGTVNSNGTTETVPGSPQYVLSDFELEQWVYPFMANAALLAFREGAVLQRQTTRWSGYNFHFIHEDTCPDGPESSRCGNVWAIQGVHRYFGHTQEVQPLPRGAVVGTWFTLTYGQTLSAFGVPTLCYGALERSLDDKSEYPYLLRTATGTFIHYVTTVRILVDFQYTKTVLLHGTDETQIQTKDDASKLWAAAGIALATISYNPGLTTGAPPKEDTETYIEYHAILQRAKEFNAHTMILEGSREDAPFDVLAFLVKNGLSPQGYLWFYMYPMHRVYGRIMELLSIVAPDSLYYDPAMVDGSIMFAGRDDSLATSREAFLLQEYLWELQNRTDDLEPWIAERIADQPEVFDLTALSVGTLWLPHTAFDAVWLMLNAANNLLLDIGPSFTSEDLLKEMWNTDLSASGGRISFSEEGVMRILDLQVRQYQPQCSASGARIPPTVSELVTVGNFGESVGVVWTAPLIFHSCGLSPPPDQDLPCEPGTFYDRPLGTCGVCELGRYTATAGMSACVHCPAGTFSNHSSSSQCVACGFGLYSEEAGSTRCSSCPPGQFQDEVLQSACRTCMPGTKAPKSGTHRCKPCEVGTYTNLSQSLECKSCADVCHGSTTAQIQSMIATDCICPEGTYLLHDGHACVECPIGMKCSLGSSWVNLMRAVSPLSFELTPSYELTPAAVDVLTWTTAYPLVEPGFMTLSQEPLVVYKCRGEYACPGGGPGTCRRLHNQDTVACGECESGAYEARLRCSTCSGAQAVWVLTFLVAGVLLIGALTCLTNGDTQSLGSASLSILAVSGLLFASIQALGVFSQVELDWPEPIRSMLQVAHFLNFDLNLLQVPCVVGAHPARHYATRQLVAPLSIPAIFVALLVKKCARSSLKQTKSQHTPVLIELTNAVGTLFSIFFISIMVSAVDPLNCYSHPGDAGSSMRSSPSVLCGSADHTVIVALGLGAIAMVAMPFLVACTYAVFIYPKCITAPDSRTFLHATRFLFIRFTTGSYYFQLIMYLRALAICLVPVILGEKSCAQVLFMTCVLCLYVIVQQEISPWKAQMCNTLDASMNLLLVVVLTVGALFLTGVREDPTILALGSVAVVSLFAAAFVGFGFSIWRRFRYKRFYDYFICHHKSAAAAQARYLKVLISQSKPYTSVFIDSDNLKDLDVLFDIMKTNVRHLLAWLTSEALKRAWCAGEIATAFTAGVVTTRLHGPGFVPPDEDKLDELSAYIDTVGCNLNEYHISLGIVRMAYKHLLSAETRALFYQDACAGTRPYARLVNELFNISQEKVSGKVPRLSDVHKHSVLLSTDAADPEANAAGGILAHYIAQDIYQINEFGLFKLADYVMYNDAEDINRMRLHVQDAAAVLVLLSRRTTVSLTQMVVICDIMLDTSETAPICVPVNTPDFEFPSTRAVKDLWSTMPNIQELYMDRDIVVAAVSSFFKQVAISLPTHASKHVLMTQALAVAIRCKKLLKSGGTSFVSANRAATAGARKESSLARHSPKHSFGSSAEASVDTGVLSTSWDGIVASPRVRSNRARFDVLTSPISSTQVANPMEDSQDVASLGPLKPLAGECVFIAC